MTIVCNGFCGDAGNPKVINTSHTIKQIVGTVDQEQALQGMPLHRFPFLLV